MPKKKQQLRPPLPQDEWNGEPHDGLRGKSLQKQLAENARAEQVRQQIVDAKKIHGCTLEQLPFVNTMRTMSLAATKRHGVPNESIICVLTNRDTPNPSAVIEVRISARHFETLSVTLWFWDKTIKLPFRQTTKVREYLHRVVTDADYGRVILRNRDTQNLTDNNLKVVWFDPSRAGKCSSRLAVVARDVYDFCDLESVSENGDVTTAEDYIDLHADYDKHDDFHEKGMRETLIRAIETNTLEAHADLLDYLEQQE